MFIYNITKGDSRENLIIKSLKMDPKDEDLVIGPGQFLTTEEYGIPERRIEQSFELKSFEKEGKIKVSRDPLHLQAKQSQNAQQQKQVAQGDEYQRKLDELSATSNLSLLEDVIDQSEDIKMIKAASKRLKDLLGEEGPDIPEEENRPNNPII
jgi:hypothetical protein